MFKFIHAADIHLDSPLLNLQQYEGAPLENLRVATREAFDNLVQLALEERAQFVLIAGDLYDKDSPDFNTPVHVRGKMRELAAAGIQVFLVQGNHDATTQTKRAFGLSMPENVHVFSTKAAETHVLEDIQVAIHGQGFAHRAVEEDLAAHFPPAVAGHYNIGLLHTNLGGNANHDNYAPTTREVLTSKAYHYWALGHIHKRNTSIGPNPHILYPGNTQGRHIREAGPKGCVLVTVDEAHRASVRFHATDVWRWQQCDVDASDTQTPADILECVAQALAKALADADDRSLAVRIRLHGNTPAHRAWMRGGYRLRDALRTMALDRYDDRIWIEKVLCELLPPRKENDARLEDAWGELLASLEGVTPSADLLDEIRQDVQKVLHALPHEERLEGARPSVEGDERVAYFVRRAKQRIAAELLHVEDDA